MSAIIITFPGSKSTQAVGTNTDKLSIQHLAASLMWCLNISSGKELIFIIGDGSERSNREAIESWIAQNYDVDDIYAMDDPVAELGKQIKAYLNNYKNNFEV